MTVRPLVPSCLFLAFEFTYGLVPILDAREKRPKLSENAKNVVETFPRFSGIILQDSVVLACYTTSQYEKNNDLYASFNILWAAILCGEDALVLTFYLLLLMLTWFMT